LDPEAINADEAEIAQHSRLENFYSSTRAAKVCHSVYSMVIQLLKKIPFMSSPQENHVRIYNEVPFLSFYVDQHLEKEMLHGIERFIIASSKQIEIGKSTFREKVAYYICTYTKNICCLFREKICSRLL